MRSAPRSKQRGILAALGTALVGGLMARDNQEDAQAHAIQVAQNKYQWTMEDMRKAGLNPMLAYSQGASASPSSAMAAAPNFAQAFMADASQQQAETSARQVELNEKQIDAVVEKTRQEVVNLKTVDQQNNALLDNIRQEYQNLVKQGFNLTEVGNQLRKTVERMDAEIPLISNQSVTESFRHLLVKAQAADSNAAALLKGNDLKAAEMLENSGAVGKALMPIAQILKMILGR